ncbi:MAG: hypothetical protein V4526_00180 [Patescibacteria group bacterium]
MSANIRRRTIKKRRKVSTVDVAHFVATAAAVIGVSCLILTLSYFLGTDPRMQNADHYAAGDSESSSWKLVSSDNMDVRFEIPSTYDYYESEDEILVYTSKNKRSIGMAEMSIQRKAGTSSLVTWNEDAISINQYRSEKSRNTIVSTAYAADRGYVARRYIILPTNGDTSLVAWIYANRLKDGTIRRIIDSLADTRPSVVELE